MSIQYSGKAESDLENILEYGHEAWPGTVEAFVDELQRRLETTLASHPKAGKVGREKGTREWVLTGTPFIVVYEPPAPPAKPDLVVVRVLHGAQQWP